MIKLHSALLRAAIFVLLLSVAPAFAQSAAVQPIANERSLAAFYLSSDQVRALRDVAPAPALVISLTRSIEILKGEGTAPADETDTLTLGPDYLVYENKARGGLLLLDFQLRRQFRYEAGKKDFRSDSLFANIDFFDMEARNRAVIARVLAAAKLDEKGVPGHEQHLFEASLHVRAGNVEPIRVSASLADHQVSVRFKGEEIARIEPGPVALDPRLADTFVRALHHLFPLHPSVIAAAKPFANLPSQITSVHEHRTSNKVRTTIRFLKAEPQTLAYPLPPGLTADLTDDSAHRGNKLIASLLSEGKRLALDAIASGKPAPSFADYLADATKTHQSGDGLGTGLALIAATTHYPDQVARCGKPDEPAYCTSYREQLTKAMTDQAFRQFTAASGQCHRGEWEAGARGLASVDVSAKAHGYVTSILMFCLLSELPVKILKEIEGIGKNYPATAVENALLAIRANPRLPAYYYEVGVKFEKNFEPWVAWRFFDLGRALGGGVAGDPFDLNVARRERELLASYPEFF